MKVDWDASIKHTPAVCFLPWIGIVVALLSAWPLFFSGLSAEIQALLMLLTAVLITGGFHEDGLMDACDGLVGGWNKEQRLEIMKDSRIGSYAALSIWFALMLKWLLLSQVLRDFSDGNGHASSALMVWIAVHCLARFTPLLLMNSMDYISFGKSKASSMIAKLAAPHWSIALLPCILLLLLDFSYLIKALVVLGLLVLGSRYYLQRRIGGFNGDTLGALEQISEVLLLLCLMGALE